MNNLDSIFKNVKFPEYNLPRLNEQYAKYVSVCETESKIRTTHSKKKKILRQQPSLEPGK